MIKAVINMRRLQLLFVIILLGSKTFAQLIAITDANIINTNDGKVTTNAVIIIENGIIKEIGKSDKIKIPENAQLVDAKAKWIMPGLIDAHIHFFQSGGLYTRPDALDLRKFYSYEKDQQWLKDNREDLLRRYLACGITTVIDVGGPMSNFDMRKYCNETDVAPNAFVTGPLISTYQPPNLDKQDPPIIKVNSDSEARALVQKQLPYKPDFIKIWYIVGRGSSAENTLSIVSAAIDESHKHNLKACVHATEYNTAKLAVQAGCDILVHSINDKEIDKSLIQLLKEKNIAYIPTLLVHSKYTEAFSQQHRLTLHDFRYANPFMLGTLFDLQHLPTKTKDIGFDYKELRTRKKLPSSTDTIMQKNLKLLIDANINVASGTDAGNIGTLHASSYMAELQQMRLSGITNAQILKASTISAARGFGQEKRLGSIEKGKVADLLILNKNPLDSLEYLDDLFLLIHRGKMINPDTLIKISPATLVQQQLNAYNARNVDAFLEPYSDSVEIYNTSNQLIIKGKMQMREKYAGVFEKIKNLHCELASRIIKSNIVIDHERVIGLKPDLFEGIAIYTIHNNKIQKVQFL